MWCWCHSHRLPQAGLFTSFHPGPAEMVIPLRYHLGHGDDPAIDRRGREGLGASG